MTHPVVRHSFILRMRLRSSGHQSGSCGRIKHMGIPIWKQLGHGTIWSRNGAKPSSSLFEPGGANLRQHFIDSSHLLPCSGTPWNAEESGLGHRRRQTTPSRACDHATTTELTRCHRPRQGNVFAPPSSSSGLSRFVKETNAADVRALSPGH